MPEREAARNKKAHAEMIKAAAGGATPTTAKAKDQLQYKPKEAENQ